MKINKKKVQSVFISLLVSCYLFVPSQISAMQQQISNPERSVWGSFSKGYTRIYKAIVKKTPLLGKAKERLNKCKVLVGNSLPEPVKKLYNSIAEFVSHRPKTGVVLCSGSLLILTWTITTFMPVGMGLAFLYVTLGGSLASVVSLIIYLLSFLSYKTIIKLGTMVMFNSLCGKYGTFSICLFFIIIIILLIYLAIRFIRKKLRFVNKKILYEEDDNEYEEDNNEYEEDFYDD